MVTSKADISSDKHMKTQNIQGLLNSFKTAGIVASLTCGVSAWATSAPAGATSGTAVGQNEIQRMAFTDSAEAKMLRDAYSILSTGDHDYQGHRVKAMHAVEAGAKLLGMDLAGDLKDRTPQKLSDEKLRQAQSLISQVLASAAVKDQKRVVKHLNKAVTEINTALSIH
jgi:hypothetical protein